MATRKEREEFIAAFSAAFPEVPAHILAKSAVALLRLAKRHGQLAADECNGCPEQGDGRLPIAQVNKCQQEWDERIAREYLKVEEGLQKVANTIPGFKVETGGDPRGYTVKIHLPTGVYNTWGGKESGYGVPQ